jgi:hypothetical protein
VPQEMIAAIIIMSGVIVYQQIFWSRQVQKLVDKLMSRSYTEYFQTQNPKPPVERFQIPEEREDLGALQGLHT